MSALHGERVHIRVVVTADVADEARELLNLGWVGGRVLAKSCRLQDLIHLLHVLVDQALLVPAQVSEEDGGGFGRLAEDARHLTDLLILLCLDLRRVEHLEVHLICLLGWLDVFVLCLEAHVILFHVEVGVWQQSVSQSGGANKQQGGIVDAPSSRPMSLSWSSKSSPLMELLKSSSESILPTSVAGE